MSKLHGGCSCSLGLCEMVCEFLVGRLGEHSLFPEGESEIAVDLGSGIKGGLDKVAQGGIAPPG